MNGAKKSRGADFTHLVQLMRQGIRTSSPAEKRVNLYFQNNYLTQLAWKCQKHLPYKASQSPVSLLSQRGFQLSIVQKSLGHWTLSNKVLDVKDHAVGQGRDRHLTFCNLKAQFCNHEFQNDYKFTESHKERLSL